MPFVPSAANVPSGFASGVFRVTPIGPAVNALDHEAVMSSVALLRDWSDSPWPEDDFGLDANADDLQMHADEHAARIAFGYSVQHADGRVLGSVYINRLSDSFEHYPVDEAARARLAPYVGRVEFWIRADALSLRPLFFDALRGWLAADWPWPVVFGARRAMGDVEQLYKSRGLVELARLVSDTGRVQALFGAPVLREP